MTDTILNNEQNVNVDEVMQKFDKESRTRTFSGVPKLIVRGCLVAFALWIIIQALFVPLAPQISRSIFLAFIMAFAFILYPANKKANKGVNYIAWYDYVLATLSLVVFLYWTFNYEALVNMSIRAYFKDVFQQSLAVIALLLLFEACRRVTGIPIIIVSCLFIGFALINGTIINGREFNVTAARVLYTLYYTLDGVFGTPIGVCVSFIGLFIIFGALLEKSGIGAFFVDLSNSIIGASDGGPAKVAVISSALMGMYSGSSVANTVGSGSITIPMMKKTGYKKEFAGAVEAAASTGGQIMPPIMGAAAFLMAEMSGYSYLTIITAAILPAILYFTGILITVHFEAKKYGLKGLPKDTLPKFGQLIVKKGYLLFPVIILVVCMNFFTAARSACLAIGAVIIVSMFDKETRLTPVKLAEAFESGTKSTIGVAIACAVAGTIVGMVTLTGLGQTLINLLLGVASNSVFLALFLTMIACIILGMGVPTTANYVIMATITAPILIEMGIPALASHMFVFYFGIVADITPPVALAAYAGSAIAGSSPMKTAFTATKLAIAAFIIPYIFALNPEMLLIDAVWYNVIQIVITSLLGIMCVSAGFEGYMLRPLTVLERLLLLGAGLILIIPEIITDIIGIIVLASCVAWQVYNIKKAKSAVVDGEIQSETATSVQNGTEE